MTATILVTGAAGLVGAEVTAALAATGHRVLALTHHQAALVRHDGRVLPATGRPVAGEITTVSGDIRADRLALPPGLTAEIDTVVHCAAATRFGLPDDDYHEVNVVGTRRVLELARAVSASVVHVSTAYVCGLRDGPIAEDELDLGQPLANAYERSKMTAEKLVRRAADAGLAATVVRPSIVAGAQRTGAIREFGNLYTLIKLAALGRLRTLPGRYDALLDIVPVDHAARVIVAAVAAGPRSYGSVLHAVGHTVSLAGLSSVLAEYPAFRTPRFVAPENFDPAALPAAERRRYEAIGSLYASYLNRRPVFDDAATVRLLGLRRPANALAYLRRMIRFGVRRGYLAGRPALERTLR
jgi:nucleoside-diphosphate-sugar epimerase